MSADVTFSSALAPSTATTPWAPLSAADRCDGCGAQAYIRVTLTSGSELLFCAHHGSESEEKLRSIAVSYHDETYRLKQAVSRPEAGAD